MCRESELKWEDEVLGILVIDGERSREVRRELDGEETNWKIKG